MVDLTLIAIIVFGFINSYTDLKFGKIKNILIIAMIIVALILNFYLNSFTWETIINSSISLALGFVLFYLNYWSAGDAKLFFAFTLLVPISIYHFGKVNFFPSISILINSFVPITIFYLFKSLTNLKIKSFIENLKGKFKLQDFAVIILYLFGFSFIFSSLNLKLDMVSFIFILFILFRVLGKLPKKYSLILFGALSILRFLFEYEKVLALSFLYDFLLTIIAYQAFSFILSFLSTLSFSRQISIDKLSPGQILGEPLFKLGNRFLKNSKDGEKITKLTQGDVSLLKQLFNLKKLNFKTLLIERTIPFAPFISIGVLLTYLFQGNIFAYMYLVYLKPYFVLI